MGARSSAPAGSRSPGCGCSLTPSLPQDSLDLRRCLPGKPWFPCLPSEQEVPRFAASPALAGSELRVGTVPQPHSLLSRHPRHSRTEHTQTPSTCLPRENRSLPPNLRLGELTQEDRGKAARHLDPTWAEKLPLRPLSSPAADPGDVEAKGGQRTLQTPLVLSEGAQTGEQPEKAVLQRRWALWLLGKVVAMSSFCPTGLVPFPMAWRIYKVPSMSSDEIWL